MSITDAFVDVFLGTLQFGAVIVAGLLALLITFAMVMALVGGVYLIGRSVQRHARVRGWLK